MSKSIKYVNGCICLEENCQYRKTCANHDSAGDFRAEGGYSPQLWYKENLFDKNKKELICESIDFESDNDPHRPLPKNIDFSKEGFVENIPNQFKMEQSKYLQAIGKEEVKEQLESFLNECLSSSNQDYSFEVKEIDLERCKMLVEFNIVAIPEDNYIGFQGF